MSKFKVGDKVKIKPEQLSNFAARFRATDVFTITRIENSCIYTDGTHGGWLTSRFDLVEEPKPQYAIFQLSDVGKTYDSLEAVEARLKDLSPNTYLVFQRTGIYLTETITTNTVTKKD